MKPGDKVMFPLPFTVVETRELTTVITLDGIINLQVSNDYLAPVEPDQEEQFAELDNQLYTAINHYLEESTRIVLCSWITSIDEERFSYLNYHSFESLQEFERARASELNYKDLLKLDFTKNWPKNDFWTDEMQNQCIAYLDLIELKRPHAYKNVLESLKQDSIENPLPDMKEFVNGNTRQKIVEYMITNIDGSFHQIDFNLPFDERVELAKEALTLDDLMTVVHKVGLLAMGLSQRRHSQGIHVLISKLKNQHPEYYKQFVQ